MSSYVIKKTSEFDVSVENSSEQWKIANEIDFLYNWVEKYPYKPKVKLKCLYSEKHIYLRFDVEESSILASAKKINDPVHIDSCVEFFCAPDLNDPDMFYNLEVNCVGIVFMCYGPAKRLGSREFVDPEILKKIKVSSTVEGPFKEIEETDKCWSIEIKIPLDIFSIKSKNGIPKSKDVWKANFYKCADDCPQLHYGSWVKVDIPKPDFHRPDFFGELIFE